MDTSTWIALAIGAVVLVLVIIAVSSAIRRRRHSTWLREQFGGEYDRVMDHAEKRRDAERDLDDRIDLREHVEVRDLSPAARDRYLAEWRDIQTRFVDRPETAVDEADALVAQVMGERGYPVDDFDTRAGLVSVDHPQLVEDYRHAHDVALQNRQREADTEELRGALLRYRSLFDALLGARSSSEA
ncbi:MAG TPA: hypothetical protein VFZ83_07960 [Acidimicrobiia bacterium]|nr:hypothetical protein [Acidimicrobiia bacterium]